MRLCGCRPPSLAQAGEEFPRGFKRLGLPTDKSYERTERFANGDIVVDDEN